LGKIPYTRAWLTGRELEHLKAVLTPDGLASDGRFTRACAERIEALTGAARVLMTPSCTAALEMAVRVLGIGPGDEVILPSFTFSSTANAVVLAGGTPVFVDIEPRTLNIDPAAVEAALNARTRAIVPIHYGGVAADMSALMAIAERHGVGVIEDAAHAYGATYDGKPLGGIGDLGCLSFHYTKNLPAGEGGALVIRDADKVERAHVFRDKGTNRHSFLLGKVDKYRWVDVGGSVAPSEPCCAIIFAQLEAAEDTNARRVKIWNAYLDGLAGLGEEGLLRLPSPPNEAGHNAHIFWAIARSGEERSALRAHLHEQGIEAPIHYVPLHSAPAGEKFARVAGAMTQTDVAGACLFRLPLYPSLGDAEVARVVDAVRSFYGRPS
jgi:dTDP-4-amino-4,6-dideoxygalactose transaminase